MTTKTDVVENAAIEYHPDYNANDANLILMAGDGIAFRVHSLIMKLASGMFEAMIEAGASQHSTQEEPIRMTEDKETLKTLLDVTYPDKLLY